MPGGVGRRARFFLEKITFQRRERPGNGPTLKLCPA
jgi:hypothetical protein